MDNALVFGLIHGAPLAKMREDSRRRDLGKSFGSCQFCLGYVVVE